MVITNIYLFDFSCFVSLVETFNQRNAHVRLCVYSQVCVCYERNAQMHFSRISSPPILTIFLIFFFNFLIFSLIFQRLLRCLVPICHNFCRICIKFRQTFTPFGRRQSVSSTLAPNYVAPLECHCARE